MNMAWSYYTNLFVTIVITSIYMYVWLRPITSLYMYEYATIMWTLQFLIILQPMRTLRLHIDIVFFGSIPEISLHLTVWPLMKTKRFCLLEMSCEQDWYCSTFACEDGSMSDFVDWVTDSIAIVHVLVVTR